MSLRGALNVDSRYNRGGSITPAPFTATVSPAVDWLSVSANTAYTGIDYAAEKNTIRAERSATIIVTQLDNCNASSAITVTQEAAPISFVINTDDGIILNGTSVSPEDGVISGLYPITSISAMSQLRTRFEIYDAITSGMTSMNRIFQDCSGMTEVNLLCMDTSNVTDFGFAFDNCSSLTSLDLHNFDTSNAVCFTAMFADCSNLTDLNISGWDTSHISDMSNIFSNCNILGSLDLSSWDTQNVTDMTGLFTNCVSLHDLTLSTSFFNTTLETIPFEGLTNWTDPENISGVINALPIAVSRRYLALSTNTKSSLSAEMTATAAAKNWEII